ncbi:YheC/YheD family protein [Oceanobacillus sp. ISL-74]|nr:YheC/YheD family protein [Oceanobacillus sp. ISL-74]
MRNFKKPFEFVRLLAKTSKYYGIDIVYCHPSDVDTENARINGKILINNKWEPINISIPEYIDLNAYCYKYKDTINYLKEKTLLSSPRRFGSKQSVYKKIIDDGQFAKIVPPTLLINSENDFRLIIEEYNKIILKPKKGHKGKGIYMINIVDGNYHVTQNCEEKIYNQSEMGAFLQKQIIPNNYLGQKYVDSTTINGDPFDCRIRLEKNGEGNWEVVINLVRIGSGNKVVSNVAQGGSVNKLKPFLKYNYPNKWNEIKEEIIYVATYLPDKIEQLFNKKTSFLGIDLGIDKEGNIYLFEVNSAPGADFGQGELANIKSDYYNYILKSNNLMNN